MIGPLPVPLFVILLVVGILALVPLVKRRLTSLHKHTIWQVVQRVSVPLFAGLLGLALGVRPYYFDVWPWLAMSAFLLVLALAAAVFSNPYWSAWTGELGQLQRWIGLVGVIAFLALLAATIVFGQPAMQRGVGIAQLMLLVLMLGLGSLPVVTMERAGQAIQRTAGVLFPTLGLIVIVALL